MPGWLLALSAGVASLPPSAGADRPGRRCPEPPRATVDTNGEPAHRRRAKLAGDAAELRDALAAAVPGDEIVLRSGKVYPGPFVLPAQPAGGAYIWIHSDDVGRRGFPVPGVRVEKSQASRLATITAPKNGPALLTADGASGYWLTGLEIATGPRGGTLDSLVEIGSRTAPTTRAERIVIDRSYIHGEPEMNVKRGVMMNGRSLAVVNSRIGEIHQPLPRGGCPAGREAQGLTIVNGPGPYKIDNNYVSASTEGMLVGGQDPANESMMPSDIQISRNHFYKPLAWKNAFMTKTGFAMKSGARVQVYGNFIENSWDNCGEQPSGIRLTVRNNSQTPAGAFQNLTDVDFAFNAIVNHGRGGLILASDDLAPSGQMTCVAIHDNLWDKIPGDFAGDDRADGRLLSLVSGGTATSPGGSVHLTIEHNTFIGSGPGLFLDRGSKRSDKNRGTILRDNVIVGRGGISAADLGEGQAALDTYFTDDLVFGRNAIVGGNSKKYGRYDGNDFAPLQTQVQAGPKLAEAARDREPD